MKRLILIWMIAIFLFLPSTFAIDYIILKNPDNETLRDNYVRASPSNADSVFDNANLFVGETGSGGEKRTYIGFIGFNSSGVFSSNYCGSNPNKLLNATLHIKTDTTIENNMVVDAHQVNTTWGESALTWNNQPCGTTSRFIDNNAVCNSTADDSLTITTADTNKWFAFEVVSTVRNAIGKQWNNASFVLNTQENGGDLSTVFHSSEAATAENRPYLNISCGEMAVETTPLEILFYNMTSEGGEGCTVWNASKTTPCTTSDTTPTVFIRANEGAYCRIGISNQNYTDMGLSRNCTGSGTQQNTCTLTYQDELTNETSFIYIGCRDGANNENRTSTSGALRISIHTSDLESIGRGAIESGIQNALGSGYTIYTDQKIYARNAANQQAVGVFDKVVKWMNKIWAFNVLTGNDTTAAMFNITPVLYALEFDNSTNSTINSTVYQLITGTK